MTRSSPERIALNQHDAETLDAVFERMFPADSDGPGAENEDAFTGRDELLLVRDFPTIRSHPHNIRTSRSSSLPYLT